MRPYRHGKSGPGFRRRVDVTIIVLAAITTLGILAIAPRRAPKARYTADNFFAGLEPEFEQAFGRAERATEK